MGLSEGIVISLFVVVFVIATIAAVWFTWKLIVLWADSGPDRESRNPLWGVLIRLNLRMIAACIWIGIASLLRVIHEGHVPDWVAWVSYAFSLWVILGPTQLGLELMRLEKKRREHDENLEG